MKAPLPENEGARLAALRQLAVLDTAPELAYDGITRLAAHICQAPMALISLTDEDRQWFKANIGFSASQAPRDVTFCAHAIMEPDLFIIPDALADERFKDNPYVTAQPQLRFYAGAALVTADGHALGTLCVLDTVPRELTPEQQEGLRMLARLTVTQLELRRHTLALAHGERERADLLARAHEARAEAEANEERYRFLAEALPQQIWTARPDGTLDYVNQPAIAYFALPPADVLGWEWQHVIHADDLPDCMARWQQALATGETYEVEFRLRRADGVYRWHLGRALPMRDAAGAIVKWFGTNTDIDEQKQLYRFAQEANRAKDEFLAMVSHELRTPLTSMMGWVELLQLGILDEPKRAHALDVIAHSAQAQLIGDLLDISRIVSGRLRLDVEPVALAPLIEAALDVVRPAAAAKAIKLQSELQPGVGAIAGDPARLLQVIWNLLSNAVKFTPHCGRVEIRLTDAGAAAEVIVTDTGAGIAPDFLPYVFERFRQGDSTTTRTHGGLGLGLAIVRHLVELHGGTVAAESAGLDQGATFRLRLPLLAARAAQPEAVRKQGSDASASVVNARVS